MNSITVKKSDTISPVSVETFNGTAHSLRDLADGQPRKFVLMEIKQINGNTDRVLRIAASPGKNVFHDKIVARLRAELKDGAVCIPHYGGKIVISPATKTVIVGGNSISYPKKMNPDEVAGLLNGAMREDFRGYRILCKDGLDDIKNLYESAIQ